MPSQPHRIVSGLKENFRKRYTVEKTNKAEMRPGEQSEGAELSGGFMERNTVERTIRTETDTRKSKRSGQARVVYVKDINRNIPTT